jgi:hypothetical protein
MPLLSLAGIRVQYLDYTPDTLYELIEKIEKEKEIHLIGWKREAK